MSIKDEQILNFHKYEWEGTVLPDLDPRQQGRYRVHIPQLMDQMKEHEGHWCLNHVAGSKLGGSKRGTYGSYTPLQPGTRVMVKFRIPSLNAGQIFKIVPDSEAKSNVDVSEADGTKTMPSTFDRDEQYVLMKTPKRYQIIYMNEDTSTDPNTIFIVFNRDGGPKSGRTITKYSEDGLHTSTRNNLRFRVGQDNTNQIDGIQSNKIGGKRITSIGTSDHLNVAEKQIIKIGGHKHEEIIGDFITKIGGVLHISADAIVLKGKQYIALDCPVIAMNNGAPDKDLETPEPTPIVPSLEE